MKKIVLIGDSIRMGYDKYVKEKLEGQAEVLFPEENCQFAMYVFRYIHEWKANYNWGDDVDLVHWNTGLWDILHLLGDDMFTPPELYRELLQRIDKRIRLIFPKAKIVFALSTSVVEEKYGPQFYRKNAEIEQYNEIAREVFAGTDVVIDDLYSVMQDAPAECRSDMTHFYTPAGTERIGNAVLDCICPLLDLHI